MMQNKIFKILLSCLLAISLSACVKNIQYKGFDLSDSVLDIAKPGIATKEVVQDSIGEPNIISVYGPQTHYYITHKLEKTAFFDSKIKDQRILRIVYDKHDVVKDAEIYDISKRKKINFSKERITLKGNEISAIQQMIGNIGKFKPSKK